MSYELINISPHTSGGGFDVNFRNDTVSISDDPGGYAISTGCGSGKTESIKSLIRHKHSDGILYCVDTISECQKMYQWCFDELVTPGIISDSDVMMINSQSPIESMKIYQDKPELITQVKILIVVQVRFFVELINYFLLYRPLMAPQPFDGDFKALMTRTDIRRYIIFDETPLFLKPFVSLTKGELAPYAVRSGKGWKCRSSSEVEAIYKTFIKGDRKMDYNDGDTRLAHIKNDVVVGEIPRKFNTWMAQAEKTCVIQYYPSDLIQSGMTSHVLIYEGAGDILIGQDSRFQLLDLPLKYNANVEFHPFTFALNRKKEPDTQSYADFVASVMSILQTSTGKTLIVVWKNFRGNALCNTDVQSPAVEKLVEALNKAGVPPDSYAVTYYGASDTKSTNAYRDYSNIILAGRWGLGGSVIEKLKRAFDCQTACMENYMMWYYVQLLCRIGIRMGNGGTYHVYYSSDHTTEFIYRLSVYFNQNIFIPLKVKTNTPLWAMIVKQYIKRGQGYMKDIKALIDHNSGLKDAIERGQPYSYSITLKDLASICPRKKKVRKDNYQRGLGKFLKILDIDLVITK